MRASNEDIAALLERVADLLEAQEANPFRVRAYRRAAGTARATPRPLVDILDEGGTRALDALPGIGPTIAAHVAEIARRGALTLIERLEAAGAVLLGALNMGEYAYDFTGENVHDGPSRNPHDTGRMTGGSSGGSGGAVAGGLVPLALGSDTNGSIRVPSSF